DGEPFRRGRQRDHPEEARRSFSAERDGPELAGRGVVGEARLGQGPEKGLFGQPFGKVLRQQAAGGPTPEKAAYGGQNGAKQAHSVSCTRLELGLPLKTRTGFSDRATGTRPSKSAPK